MALGIFADVCFSWEGRPPCRPTTVRRYQHHLTAPTERTPSRASASNGHGFVATMIEGGLEGLRSLAAAVRRHQDRFTAPTERTPSRASAHNGHGFVATMIEGGLEGFAVPRSRGAPISRPFHGANGADALQGIGPQWPFLKRIAYLNCGPNSGLVLNFVPQPRRAVVDMARVT